MRSFEQVIARLKGAAKRARAWIAMIGVFAIVMVYILRAQAAGAILTKERFNRATAHLPAAWSRNSRRWLEFCLGTTVEVRGISNDLMERMQKNPVFVLGNHHSMGEVIWDLDFYSNTVGHVLRIVTKMEMLTMPLGRAMNAILIAWFIPREDGPTAVQIIREGVIQTTELFGNFISILFTDGTKPTVEKIAKGRSKLHKLAQKQGSFGTFCTRLMTQFTTTHVPSAGGAAATIEAARGIDGAIAIYKRIRSPRHVATPMQPAEALDHSLLLRFLRWLGIRRMRNPRKAAELAMAWAYVLDLIDQAEALIDQIIEIEVEELDIATEANVVGAIGQRDLVFADLSVVPTTKDRDRFYAWILLKGARTDRWIAEASNSIPLAFDEGNAHSVLRDAGAASR